MKKTFALLLVIVLTLSLSVVAFAVPTSQGGKIEAISVNDGSLVIKPVSEVVARYDTTTKDAVEAVNATAAAQAIAQTLNVRNASDLAPAALVDIDDQTLHDDYAGEPVTLDVSSIAADGKRVVVLHYLEATHEWERIADTVVSGGKITITAKSYSPFLFLVGDPLPGDNGGSNVTAPKTADTTPVALLTGLAVMSVLGCAYCIKRSRA